MPELPEVESVARGLRRSVLGACIETSCCRFPAAVGCAPSRFDEQVRGRTVEEVRRHGKYLFLCLSGSRTLALHLRMTGQFFLVPRDARPDKHTHVELILRDRPQKLVYRDVRKFGRLLPLAGSMEEFLAAHRLGPDALQVRLPELRRALNATGRAVKAALLDQTLVAGLGNIYTDEVLFRACIHPLRPARSLRDEEVGLLLRTIHSVLRAAIARKGTTVSDFVTAEGSAGGYQSLLRVYGRGGRPCSRCGRPIQKIRVAGRSTCFCPRCQRLAPGRFAPRRLAPGRTARGPR